MGIAETFKARIDYRRRGRIGREEEERGRTGKKRRIR